MGVWSGKSTRCAGGDHWPESANTDTVYTGPRWLESSDIGIASTWLKACKRRDSCICGETEAFGEGKMDMKQDFRILKRHIRRGDEVPSAA